MSKTIFNFHPVTGEFMGAGEADESPLEEGVFLVPAYATENPPPEAAPNKVPVFDGENWYAKDDFRGQVGYAADGTEKMITEIGDTLQSLGLTAEKPVPPEEVPPPLTPEQILAVKKAERAKIVSEIVVTTQAGNRFDGNEDAQNRMSRAINGALDGESMPWILADNSMAMVSKEELREALRLAGLEQSRVWGMPYAS